MQSVPEHRSDVWTVRITDGVDVERFSDGFCYDVTRSAPDPII